MWPVLFVIACIALLSTFSRGPNAVWGGATVGLLVGLVWGLIAGEGIALILRGAVVGAVIGIPVELLSLVGSRGPREERGARAQLVAMGLDPDNLPEPGSKEYKALVEKLSRQGLENMMATRGREDLHHGQKVLDEHERKAG